MGGSILEIIQERGLEAIGRYYSKYRAIVVDNNDPENRNRLKVVVPEITQDISDWANPVNQLGEVDSGFKLLTPKVGSIVWVEYKNGDPLYPLWSYHGWAVDEIPDELRDLNSLGIVTFHNHKIIINDDKGILKLIISDLSNPSKETFSLVINKDTLSIKGKKIILLEENFGIPLTDKLVERINILEKEINKLRSLFKSSLSQVKPQDGGLSLMNYIYNNFNNDLTETRIEDIENKNITQ